MRGTLARWTAAPLQKGCLMSDPTRLTHILQFLEILDQFKSIFRANYVGGQSRKENDAEHTWHMAMFALLLQQELSMQIDLEQTLKLILTHDLVEIYAGDTPAYDAHGHLDKEERERRAAHTLFAHLPEDLRTQLDDWWHEFEAGHTPEAKYARALDKLQSFAQNVFSRGRNWQEYGVRAEQSRAYNRPACECDPVLTRAFDLLYRRAEDEHLWPEPEQR